MYLRSNGVYKPISISADNTPAMLPPLTFAVGFNPREGYFLKEIDNFVSKSKLYGGLPERAERIMKTFNQRSHSTGVLLAGEKGSGKSLLAKQLSIVAREAGMPTIVVNDAHYGEDFNQFIQNIDQPAVVILDEFEKTYDREEQQSALTLLDGMYPSKKLFILTVNNKYSVDANMRNRPGRLYYALDYEGIEPKFIREYCQDMLNDQSFTERIVQLAYIVTPFNFDMLQALVEEMNRYNESPESALQMLNIAPERESESNNYDVTFVIDGIEVKQFNYYPASYFNPLTGSAYLSPAYDEDHTHPNLSLLLKIDDEISEANERILNPANLISVRAEEGIFVYSSDDFSVPWQATLQRKKTATYDWRNLSAYD